MIIVANKRKTTAAAELQQRLAAGMQVEFTGRPELNMTLALDDETQREVTQIQNDLHNGLGFPNGAATFDYPDGGGVPHSFDEVAFVALYLAMRDFVYGLYAAAQTLEQGGAPEWPPQPWVVTI